MQSRFVFGGQYEDGLTYVQELKYNCKGWISDTDEEGLLDGEE